MDRIFGFSKSQKYKNFLNFVTNYKIYYFIITIPLIVSPILILFYYINQYGVDVPYYDTWRSVDYIEKFMHHKLELSSLFDAVGPHKGALGLVFTLINVKLFHWNIRLHYFLGFIFQIFSSILLAIIYWNISSYIKNIHLRILGFFPIILVFLSLRQWENSLATWSVSFNGGVFFSLLGIFLINKLKFGRIIFASFAGILGTLTFITGLIIWPIGFFQILLGLIKERKLKINYWYLVFWLICSIIAILIYLPGVRIPESSATSMSSIVPTIVRFFITLGTSLSLDKGVISGQPQLIIAKIDGPVLFLFGIIIFLIMSLQLFFSWFFGSKPSPLILSIILFGLISIGLTAIGRVELGYQQSMSSRYTTYSNIFLIGTYLLLFEVLNDPNVIILFKNISKGILNLFIILIMLSNMISTITELNMGVYRREFYQNWANTILNYSIVPDEKLVNPHFKPAQIREFSGVLEQLELSIFRK